MESLTFKRRQMVYCGIDSPVGVCLPHLELSEKSWGGHDRAVSRMIKRTPVGMSAALDLLTRSEDGAATHRGPEPKRIIRSDQCLFFLLGWAGPFGS